MTKHSKSVPRCTSSQAHIGRKEAVPNQPPSSVTTRPGSLKPIKAAKPKDGRAFLPKPVAPVAACSSGCKPGDYSCAGNHPYSDRCQPQAAADSGQGQEKGHAQRSGHAGGPAAARTATTGRNSGQAPLLSPPLLPQAARAGPRAPSLPPHPSAPALASGDCRPTPGRGEKVSTRKPCSWDALGCPAGSLLEGRRDANTQTQGGQEASRKMQTQPLGNPVTQTNKQAKAPVKKLQLVEDMDLFIDSEEGGEDVKGALETGSGKGGTAQLFTQTKRDHTIRQGLIKPPERPSGYERCVAAGVMNVPSRSARVAAAAGGQLLLPRPSGGLDARERVAVLIAASGRAASRKALRRMAGHSTSDDDDAGEDKEQAGRQAARGRGGKGNGQRAELQTGQQGSHKRQTAVCYKGEDGTCDGSSDDAGSCRQHRCQSGNKAAHHAHNGPADHWQDAIDLTRSTDTSSDGGAAAVTGPGRANPQQQRRLNSSQPEAHSNAAELVGETLYDRVKRARLRSRPTAEAAGEGDHQWHVAAPLDSNTPKQFGMGTRGYKDNSRDQVPDERLTHANSLVQRHNSREGPGEDSAPATHQQDNEPHRAQRKKQSKADPAVAPPHQKQPQQAKPKCNREQGPGSASVALQQGRQSPKNGSTPVHRPGKQVLQAGMAGVRHQPGKQLGEQQNRQAKAAVAGPQQGRLQQELQHQKKTKVGSGVGDHEQVARTEQPPQPDDVVAPTKKRALMFSQQLAADTGTDAVAQHGRRKRIKVLARTGQEGNTSTELGTAAWVAVEKVVHGGRDDQLEARPEVHATDQAACVTSGRPASQSEHAIAPHHLHGALADTRPSTCEPSAGAVPAGDYTSSSSKGGNTGAAEAVANTGHCTQPVVMMQGDHLVLTGIQAHAFAGQEVKVDSSWLRYFLSAHNQQQAGTQVQGMHDGHKGIPSATPPSQAGADKPLSHLNPVSALPAATAVLQPQAHLHSTQSQAAAGNTSAVAPQMLPLAARVSHLMSKLLDGSMGSVSTGEVAGVLTGLHQEGIPEAQHLAGVLGSITIGSAVTDDACNALTKAVFNWQASGD